VSNFILENLGTIRINGIKTPGIAWVTSPKTGQEWQNSQGFAMSGPVTRYAGNIVKTGSVKFVLTEAEKVEFMARIFPYLEPVTPPKRPTKIDVVHTYFASARVREVGTATLEGPFYDTETEKGAWVVNWAWQDFAPAKPLPSRVIDPLRPFESDAPAKTKAELAMEKVEAENTEFKAVLGDR
jgi:hypothetical protein